ncbi:MAG: murein L,D-transpeptidase, partial [Allosphingosinicella sp.]
QGFAPAAVQAAVPSSSLEEAVRAQASSDRTLRHFYALRGYKPLWTDGTGIFASAERMLERLKTADADGLDPGDYQVRRLRQAFDAADSPKALARAEILLSKNLMKYVRDLHRAPAAEMTYVDPALIPTPPTPGAALERMAQAGNGSLAPALATHPIYEDLRAYYVQWRRGRTVKPGVRVPEGPPLKVGSTGPRVQALRARLGLDREGPFGLIDAAAVRAFQAENGIPVTGTANAQTLALLNPPASGGGDAPGDVERSLRLNLERARALPAAAERYVLVDAAAQRLWLYEDGKVKDTMRVIVGRVNEPTPMLAAYIRYAALNPYWNVPTDLVRTRVAPHVLKQGLGYLKAQRYEILESWDEGAKTVDPKTIDWRAVVDGKVDLAMRQLPGPKNSMGNIKFMFPNQYGVYLHDTPEKKLFGSDDRSQSAGCVRLEDAPKLARWLFGRMPSAKGGKPEQQVPLEKPVPVYITYLTAAPTENGIAFREDFYGRDGKAALSLAQRD